MKNYKQQNQNKNKLDNKATMLKLYKISFQAWSKVSKLKITEEKIVKLV